MNRLARMSFLLLVSIAACKSPVGVDDPCETTEDCDEGLECDLHEGEGTCQEPHAD